MENVKTQTSLSYSSICIAVRVPYGTFRRWKARQEAGQPLVMLPGPKKVEPLDLDRMREDIRALEHRKKRSFGTQELLKSYAGGISRRKFQELVRMARFDANVDHRKNLRRIHWHVPNLVWAADDTEYEEKDEWNLKLFIHNTRDLASHYQLKPVGGQFARGRDVAKHLARQFERHGAPLFYKRDNGGNLNHSAVNRVLAKYGVIPLNSPMYYAPYNGAIEHAQNEIKELVAEKLQGKGPIPGEHFGVYAEASAHDLNHRSSRSLNGKTPCRAFHDGKARTKYNKRKRRKIFEWIVDLRNRILTEMGSTDQRAVAAAWRIAAETWLHKNGHISITINGKSVTPFSGDFCS